MRIVLIGGAPGVGKSTVTRLLLGIASGGSTLVQWVDVDGLWRHSPRRDDAALTRMRDANLAAVVPSAADAGVEVLIATAVFSSEDERRAVTAAAPADAEITTIQLHVDLEAWHDRIDSDADRPPVDEAFRRQHEGAQSIAADHVLDTSDVEAEDVASAIALILELG